MSMGREGQARDVPLPLRGLKKKRKLKKNIRKYIKY
jgi:hypothetical protein